MAQRKLLNPCVDPIFKALFTNNSDEARGALRSFLQAVLGQKVTDVKLQPNELPSESSTDRQTQFDLTCKIDGEFANIEMQGRNINNSFGKRAEYNAAHILNHYMPKGTDWPNVPKVYQISVMNFTLGKANPSGLIHYKMRDELGNPLEDRLNVIFLELPKYGELKDDAEKLTAIEKWGKFFLDASKDDKQEFIQEICRHEEGIMQAQKVLSDISMDEAQWQAETSYYRWLSDLNTARVEGFEQGQSEGQILGKREVALNFLKSGVDINLVVQCTGLSIEELEKLRDSSEEK